MCVCPYRLSGCIFVVVSFTVRIVSAVSIYLKIYALFAYITSISDRLFFIHFKIFFNQ